VSRVTVRFAGGAFPPVEVPAGAELALVLDRAGAPVLFGCRTGLCGTCTSEVEGDLPPPSAEEREVLDIEAPDAPRARLVCQLRPHADLTIVRALR
jgi:ferredoxin